MYLAPAPITPKKTEQLTAGFKGLNRLPVTEEGELTAMTNVSGLYAPALCPRDSREVVRTLTNGTALFAANNKLCWVDGTGFYYDGTLKGAVTFGPKSMAEYFGTILIFPDAVYYNYTTDVFGTITTAAGLGIKYVCVHNNRAYGVGGNAFYASKATDPLTWNDFPVPITTGCSWQTNTGEDGDFTGIKVSLNQVKATKPGHLYELYGDKPSNFNLHKVVDVGCSDNKSIVEIDGKLHMMNTNHFCAYAGSVPVPTSLKLNEKYLSCVAGTDGRRYFASLYNGSVYNLYVYDTYSGYWYREDNMHVLDFARIGNDLYALAGDNRIYKFNSGSEAVGWEVESERFTDWYMGKKTNLNVKIMAELEQNSVISVYCSMDGGPYVWKNTTAAAGLRTFEIKITPQRCNWFQIKVVFAGKAKFYGFSREVLYGSTI